MNSRNSIVYAPRSTFASAVLLGFATLSCAAPRGIYLPRTTDHPANPAAQEGEIQDPGKILTSGVHHSQPEAGAPHAHEHDATAPSAARYVCPMHPDVVSDQPGKCPRCGMTLEERKPDAPQEPHHDH